MATDVVAALRAAGCVFAEQEAALLIEAAADEAHLADLVSRRAGGEPLEYLVGFVEFLGVRYRIRPGVFIPRQRSALLVEEAARRGGATILDLCCGCGALGLATQARIGGRLVAADVSPAAVDCARLNGVSDAHLGDLFDALPRSYLARFDLILANAPYVPTASVADMPRESRDHEPLTTVDGGSDGMEVQRRILRDAAAWLAPGGSLVTETSRQQAAMLADEARAFGWQPTMVADADRGAEILVVEQ